MSDDRKQQDRDKRDIERKNWEPRKDDGVAGETEVSFDRPIPSEKPKKD